MQLPPFVAAGSVRPVDLARPVPLVEPLAPYLCVEAVGGPASVALTSGGDRLAVTYDGVGCSLTVTVRGSTSEHRSRRHGKPEGLVERVALTLTGTRAAALTREAGAWVVRGFVDLRDRLDTHDESWLAGVRAEGGELRGFGQLGLRDLRLVTHADGSPYRDGSEVLLTATSAGPGFFDTAHTSIWSLDPATTAMRHRSDVFFRRTGQPGVYGDHASHLLRDGDRWLLATSTWGDFDHRRKGAHVGATLAETTEDLLTGRHALDTRPLPLPTTGLTSVGVWDPHLVRTDDGWLAAYVSATKFFRFHPVLASGATLDDLWLRAAASGHRETEGVTLHRFDGTWHVLASDGVRRRYPVLDLDLTEVGVLDAAHESNIPWPTLLEHGTGMLLIGFDGEPVGGRLVGYGSHGAVRFARSV
ncbi:hypothetical protein [Nocardioides sp.]|uniref:hypothetical protein n=1 Tax=Nocardioides sp. TaxID=35761 RepID=UPI002ED3C847